MTWLTCFQAFAVTIDPQPVCTDVEGAVTYALADSGNSSRFRIVNTNNGLLALAANYDVDSGDWPTRDVIEILCKDAGDIGGLKLTDTASIVVAINVSMSLRSEPIYAWLTLPAKFICYRPVRRGWCRGMSCSWANYFKIMQRFTRN